jgi:putative ABC transport system permease protein
MLLFNLKLALRNFVKNRKYTLVNIVGLGFGLSAFLIISLYLQFHLSFDKFNKNYQSIYRIDQKVPVSGETDTYSCTPFALSPKIKQDFPEILASVRLMYCNEFLSSSKECTFYERRGYFADPSIFDVFDFEFVRGNPKTALLEPYSIVITEELAKKYFPGKNPIGETLKFQTGYNLKVTGVMKELPANSSLRPRYLVNFSILNQIFRLNIEEKWDWCMADTYVLLQEKTDARLLIDKVNKELGSYDKNSKNSRLALWPLRKEHLQYTNKDDSRSFFYLLGIIAFFTLIIACINFMNLSTAYSSVRLKEIGLRKISGASRISIISQFLGEALIISFISLLFALSIAEILLPFLSRMIGQSLKFQFFNHFQFFLYILGATLLTGLLSGSYSAFYLSSLQPAYMSRGKTKIASGNPFLRKVLVIFQFVISVVLIIVTILIFKQLDYMKNKKLGFDKENILIGYIQLTGEGNVARYDALKNELLCNPAILSMTWDHNAPFFNAEWWNVSIEGKPEDQKFRMQHNHVDFDFLKTFGIKMKEGRALSEDYPSDKIGSCVINEEAVRQFGWTDGAIGKRISNDNINYTVVGVMHDFHIYTVAVPIESYFISYSTRHLSWPNSHAIKIAANQDVFKMKKFITSKFQAYFPNDNIEFNILDENFGKRNYGDVELIAILIGVFAFLAVSISSIGLFGLISFITKQRTKEIGIRKANGATIVDLFKLICKEFIIILFIANAIAFVLAYFIADKILQNFAYRINIGLSVFIMAAALSIVITVFTVSYQIFQASRANPVDSLRYE